MSYSSLGQADSSLPPDVAPTLVHELAQPLARRRGWVAVPTRDVRDFVQTQLLVAAAGFTLGLGVGAFFGNVLGTRQLGATVTKVIRNPRRRRRPRRNAKRRTSRRRTSTRKRKRGRPTAKPANEGWFKVTLPAPWGVLDVSVENGVVHAMDPISGWDIPYGHVYDMETSFRAVPRGGEVRSFGTLAGAVKHVIRKSEAA